MPEDRKPISKKMRFEVFKRDGFTCQYCGKSAPDVVLHIDHIEPVKNGGKSEILNYLTACIDCNLGKGARELSDNSVVSKQQAQLQQLNERKEQMKLMLKWRNELAKLDDVQAKEVERAFHFDTGYSCSKHGRKTIKQWLKKYSMLEILEAVDRSRLHYLVHEGDNYTQDSVNKAFNFIPRICSCRRIEQENPHIKDLNYIKGIVRNRCNYFNPSYAAQIVNRAYNAGVPIDIMMETARNCRNWSSWQSDMNDLSDGWESSL